MHQVLRYPENVQRLFTQYLEGGVAGNGEDHQPEVWRDQT